MTRSSKENSLEFVVYAILLVFVSLYIYVANDESQPLIGIFRLGYLIPCVVYSSVVIFISLSLFNIIKTIIKNRSIALSVAIFGGIPVGLYILFQFTNWIFK